MNRPSEITVLLPVFNGRPYVSEAIESILDQSFTNFELLIVEDGSTDGTPEILQRYAQKDDRVRILYNKENLGLIKTLNVGLANARGKYLARQDADDVSLGGRLATQYEFLESHPDYVLAGSEIEIIDAQGARINAPRREVHSDAAIRVMMLLHSAFVAGTAMMRRETIENNKLRYSLDMLHAEDFDFYWRLLKHGKGINLKKPLMKYRFTGGNISEVWRDVAEETASKISFRNLQESGWRPALSLQEVRKIRGTLAPESPAQLQHFQQIISTLKELAGLAQQAYPVTHAELKLILGLWCHKALMRLGPDLSRKDKLNLAYALYRIDPGGERFVFFNALSRRFSGLINRLKPMRPNH
jgi:hypothetical protein